MGEARKREGPPRWAALLFWKSGALIELQPEGRRGSIPGSPRFCGVPGCEPAGLDPTPARTVAEQAAVVQQHVREQDVEERRMPSAADIRRRRETL